MQLVKRNETNCIALYCIYIIVCLLLWFCCCNEISWRHKNATSQGLYSPIVTINEPEEGVVVQRQHHLEVGHEQLTDADGVL